MTQPTMNEVIRWNPDRIDVNTRFVTATKIAQVLGMPPSILFNKYPRMFRVSSQKTVVVQKLLYSSTPAMKTTRTFFTIRTG